MSHRILAPALALLASVFVTPALGQLTTDCQPLNKTCPPDPALGTTATFNFNSTPPDSTWTIAGQGITYDETNGGTFEISAEGQAPTLISDFYFLWGRTEVLFKAAQGQGVISSIVWGSDTLDEVDLEFKGSNNSYVFTNYYRNGVDDATTGGSHPINGDIHDLHNYTTTWDQDALSWYFDGTLLRTLTYAAANASVGFPQTPMKLRLGNWVAGDPKTQANGTIEWAQGVTDFSQAPFTMYVQSAKVVDGTSGSEYTYSDRSGTWESIKVTAGNSTAAQSINKPPSESISQKFDALPQATKTGIYAAAGAVGGILFLLLGFYYFKQRRRGAREAAAAQKRYDDERFEMEKWAASGRNPDALAYEGVEVRSNKGNTYAAVPNPDSPPPSSHGAMAEKAWDPTEAAPRSPMPLLQNNMSNSRVGSPGSGMGMNAPSRNNSYTSPVRSQSPSIPPNYPLPSAGSPVQRVMSASPHAAPTRSITPGSTAGGFGGINRMNSPGPTRSPSSPAPQDMYGMGRVNSPRPQRGPGSPGPQQWNNGGYRS
ncbi:glycoside hydrolase family 16 protein [Xylariaceae sp. FL0255]|nr:glycoside hydrolase family 16 protein [Xylariaceae sp. FL0255]